MWPVSSLLYAFSLSNGALATPGFCGYGRFHGRDGVCTLENVRCHLLGEILEKGDWRRKPPSPSIQNNSLSLDMVGKYLNPRNDIAFKKIFGSEKNKNILLALLNSVLKQQLQGEIKDATFLQRAQDPETAVKKSSVVDLKCEDDAGNMYIIEMQVAKNTQYKERAQYYASKAYISQANKGGEYSGLKKVIFLAFTNYSVFPKKEAHKSDHQILDVVTQENDLDRLCFTIVDLVKFDAQNKKALGNLTLEEKFYYFLRHADEITPEDLEAITKDEPIIKQAFDALNITYFTDEEYELYEELEKKEWDWRTANAQAALDKGREEGKLEGAKSREIEIAKNLFKQGVDISIIQQATGLSISQITRLKDELEKSM